VGKGASKVLRPAPAIQKLTRAGGPLHKTPLR
jgi:hypothetical protein